jgi:hypothetical protein
MKRYKRHRDYGFFDQDIRLSKLSQLGDPLEKLNSGVDFEIFRQKLEQGLTKVAKGKGGRPPYDYVLMFKILIQMIFLTAGPCNATTTFPMSKPNIRSTTV